ncbi:hypothetical protein ACIOWI_29855 [Streptomyces sp. NPDC087659]|uniref:hypothetical protein n=1 Tax=Streptomyces sp. NPDC087659 TaxID=3365801 RepID=UPI00380CAC75
MDAVMVTAIAALASSPLAAAAAVYGSRIAGRAQREGNAVTGFSNLTDQLQEERQDLRNELAAMRAELAAERAENARLKALVTQLGGTP